LDWSAIEKFFSKTSTKEAFNLGDFNPDYDWVMCNIGTEMNYIPVEGGTKETIVNLIKDHGIYVTLYSGLNDSTVPYMTS
jgi:hypothetical protein